MKFRFSLIALVSAVSLPALATSGITPVPGEAGFTTHAMPSAKTRADVVKDLQAWKRNPVTADGWREVGGDAGWVFVGTNQPGKTRAAVIAETMQAKRNPVSADGWLDVGGEAGAVYVGVPGDTRSAANVEKPSRGGAVSVPGGMSRSGHQSGATATSHVHR
ncbi:MAG: hypothetical protein AB1430_21375 [Pseudomonadota bacterium]